MAPLAVTPEVPTTTPTADTVAAAVMSRAEIVPLVKASDVITPEEVIPLAEATPEEDKAETVTTPA
jgi:hypothetical protein